MTAFMIIVTILAAVWVVYPLVAGGGRPARRQSAADAEREIIDQNLIVLEDEHVAGGVNHEEYSRQRRILEGRLAALNRVGDTADADALLGAQIKAVRETIEETP